MTTANPSRVIDTARGGRPRGERQTMVPVKMTVEERARFKVACAEEGNLSYAGLIIKFLDERDARRERARSRQAHPFHRPGQ